MKSPYTLHLNIQADIPIRERRGSIIESIFDGVLTLLKTPDTFKILRRSMRGSMAREVKNVSAPKKRLGRTLSLAHRKASKVRRAHPVASASNTHH